MSPSQITVYGSLVCLDTLKLLGVLNHIELKFDFRECSLFTPPRVPGASYGALPILSVANRVVEDVRAQILFLDEQRDTPTVTTDSLSLRLQFFDELDFLDEHVLPPIRRYMFSSTEPGSTFWKKALRGEASSLRPVLSLLTKTRFGRTRLSADPCLSAFTQSSLCTALHEIIAERALSHPYTTAITDSFLEHLPFLNSLFAFHPNRRMKEA